MKLMNRNVLAKPRLSSIFESIFVVVSALHKLFHAHSLFPTPKSYILEHTICFYFTGSVALVIIPLSPASELRH
jgi:hypothetical protein